ncbi:pantoate--beta-alanine ligase [Pedobacter yulinensis]|uniref:Pantothenate synthetase n=1 Tax=Pedobacter yulinensis TaxID=2126353 RepID=A0A2T3HR01_9SPHI|nr:pantoate--beta-alanine ligase [Pedobacter yulinensis]PST84890.1 pantoate--beta-alanine ligase [Pedobacter yulinensis]
MEVVNTVSALKALVAPLKNAGKKIALVPTMGALHNGHISLIESALVLADTVICSIFVNPTQFTDPKDLERYPRPLQKDLNMLIGAGCNILFMPDVQEMYPEPEQWYIDLGETEFLLEGAFRKGHYQGVTQIVKKLFDAATPDVALFGQKDYQQVLMIRKMTATFNMPIEIVSCPIIRERDGLAMSSRNIHLSETDRKHALILSRALQYVQANFRKKPIAELLEHAQSFFRNVAGLELEYFTIADGETLQPVTDDAGANVVALVAARVGTTRLIDNMILS